MPDAAAVTRALAQVAGDFRADALARGTRTSLDHADFDRLREAGFTLAGVPAAMGGLWQGLRESIRPCAEMVRTVALGDPAVALVAAMHPGVLGYWLAVGDVAGDVERGWREQCADVFGSVLSGAWWGTINSEPGSGGDVQATKSVARCDAQGIWRVSGDKHFGSGAGVLDHMITVARPHGEDAAATFFVSLAGVPWDGSRGLLLTRAWDGRGMRATQSHAFRFDDFPATRMVNPAGDAGVSTRVAIGEGLGQLIACLFTAVAVGIVREAMRWARPRVGTMRLRAYTQSEWVRVENAAWLLDQAYEGMLAAVERGGPDALGACVRGKVVVAELAEDLLLRAQRVLGGGSLSASSPIGQWFDDVRALGFLRPPWALAFDQLAALGSKDA